MSEPKATISEDKKYRIQGMFLFVIKKEHKIEPTEEHHYFLL